MPQQGIYRCAIYLTAGLVVYVLLMLFNPARVSLRDGMRCLRRYWMIWAIPMLFGLCYAVFNLGLEIYENSILPDGMKPVFAWSRPWFLPREDMLDVLRSAVLPALEGLAGLFNVLVVTFPFSVVAALLFFINWGGHHAVLLSAVRRRFGALAWPVHAGILVCAAAALARPILFTPLFFNTINSATEPLLLLLCSEIVNWLSFVFEVMFGICVQVYLILMVYAWVRGLNFTHRHLMDFAIRRFSYVMNWAALGLLLDFLFIHLPMILAAFPGHSIFDPDTVSGFVNHTGRPVMAGFFILFSGMQVILTFHNESLVKALRDLLHFLLKEWWTVGWFLFIALLHFYILNAVTLAVQAGFGMHTGPTIAWSMVYPLLSAFVGGWMLAAWVCLYKRSETGRLKDEHWIQY